MAQVRTSSVMTVEDLLREAKPFGWFQVAAILFICSSKGLIAWSMLQMAFAGAVPDWWCQSNATNASNVPDNATFKTCDANSSSCARVFSSDIRTVVNEWDLVCENAWKGDIIISIQMAGVLLGSIVGGQAAEILGRKKTHYVTLALHAVVNVAAAFSTSWWTFAICRFFIGMLLGAILVISYTYVMEFLGPKARATVPWVPDWNTGAALFALAGWLMHDWAYLHHFLAALHLPFLLGVFITPESLRWLVVHGRLEEAEKCLATVARYNRVPMPANAAQKLERLSYEMKKEKDATKKISYIDLLRNRTLLKGSAIITLNWLTMSILVYGINFGVRTLPGNRYLNLFMLNVIEPILAPPSIFLSNRIGRRWTAATWLYFTCFAALVILIILETADGHVAEMATLVLSIVAKITVGAAWQVHVTLVSEIYPTSHRALGYGTANSAARVGGILAPFVVSMESEARLVVSYVVVAALTALSATACLLLPETKGKALQDTIGSGTSQTVLEVLTVPEEQEQEKEKEQEKDHNGFNHHQQERENP